MRVALIYGGEGLEREVSISGFRHLFPILREKYDLLPIYIDTDGNWIYKTERVFPTYGGFYSKENEIFYPIDAAFPLLHGDLGEDGIIQGALRTAKIPFVGCDTGSGAIARDKWVVKSIAKDLGIPTLPACLLKKGERPALPLPLFIKPTSLGSSLGCGEARDEKALSAALDRAFAVSPRVMAEPLLEGKRELECGYFATKSKELFPNPGEILTDSFYDYGAKYNGGTRVRAKADLNAPIRERIKDYSRRLVEAIGIRQIARIDFFLSGDRLYLNEINTMPGFTPDSLYPKMLEGEGIGLSDLLSGLIEGCL